MKSIALLIAAATVASAQSLEQLEADGSSAALAWLARQQQDDGHFRSPGSETHDFTDLYEPDAWRESDVLATAVAVLAFLGDGEGRYGEAAKRGQAWLASRMDEGGALARGPATQGESLAERDRRARQAHVARLNHLWGTLALLEFAAQGGDRKARALAARAVAFVTDEDAGFLDPKSVNMDEIALIAAIRYVAGKHRVPLETGLFEEALEAHRRILAGMTGTAVPYRATEEGEYWFQGSISTPQSMIAFVYFHVRGGAAMRQMEAAGPKLLERAPAWSGDYEIVGPSGHPEEEEATVVATPELRRFGRWRDDVTNEASWFWQSMAFRSLGGAAWAGWRRSFVPMARRHQRSDGSWDPAGPHARVFGRGVSTAWMAIAIEPGCRLSMSRTSWGRVVDDPRADMVAEHLKHVVKERTNCRVCGIEIMTDTPFSVWREGENYFCTAECQHHFEMDPEKHLNK